jgi:Ribbon-helix-helix protein, copG family
MKAIESQASAKRRTTFMIDASDVAELEAIADIQRVSLAWVIRDAVKRYLSDRARPRSLTINSQSGRRAQ